MVRFRSRLDIYLQKRDFCEIRGHESTKTPNHHSVIASDVEMCCKTPPQLNLLNRARVSEPEAEHKTLCVG